jgi:hypothetical protein
VGWAGELGLRRAQRDTVVLVLLQGLIINIDLTINAPLPGPKLCRYARHAHERWCFGRDLRVEVGGYRHEGVVEEAHRDLLLHQRRPPAPRGEHLVRLKGETIVFFRIFTVRTQYR